VARVQFVGQRMSKASGRPAQTAAESGGRKKRAYIYIGNLGAMSELVFFAGGAEHSIYGTFRGSGGAKVGEFGVRRQAEGREACSSPHIRAVRCLRVFPVPDAVRRRLWRQS